MHKQRGWIVGETRQIPLTRLLSSLSIISTEKAGTERSSFDCKYILKDFTSNSIHMTKEDCSLLSLFVEKVSYWANLGGLVVFGWFTIYLCVQKKNRNSKFRFYLPDFGKAEMRISSSLNWKVSSLLIDSGGNVGNLSPLYVTMCSPCPLASYVTSGMTSSDGRDAILF